MNFLYIAQPTFTIYNAVLFFTNQKMKKDLDSALG